MKWLFTNYIVLRFYFGKREEIQPQLTLLSLVFVLCLPLVGFAQIISNVAGANFAPEGILALSASINSPGGVAVNATGVVYISDTGNHRVCKLNSNGTLVTVAGNGLRGFSGDQGPALAARLYNPSGLAFDADGNLFIVDGSNHSIRKVSTNGIITTVVGMGVYGFSGDNGPAVMAKLSGPNDITFDAGGNLYIADRDNNRIRKVNPEGTITTIAGTGQNASGGDNGPATAAQLWSPSGIASDATGNIYIADAGNNRVRKITTAGVITTVAGAGGGGGYGGDNGLATVARLYHPMDVWTDAGGNLIIADQWNQRIRKVNTSGMITTIVGNGSTGSSGDNGPATAARLNAPASLAIDQTGNLYIAETTNARIRKVTPSGTIYTIAGSGATRFYGDGGPANLALFNFVDGIAYDPTGNLYISDRDNYRVRKISTNGNVSTVAGTDTEGSSGDNGPATSAQLSSPDRLLADGAGNLYIAVDHSSIRRINPAGIITTIAGTGISGYNGDYGLATSAWLNFPAGMTLDASGNLYTADQFNNRIRKISTSGIITTVAGTGSDGYSGDNGPATSARLNKPSDLAFDASGNLYIADEWNNRIRKISTNGIISTVAGTGTAGYAGDNGLATACQLNIPCGITFDASGNLYIADKGNYRIRKVGTNGIITTLAGTGTAGYSGDNGFAQLAQLGAVTDMVFDNAGNFYIIDLNNQVRKVSFSSSLFTVKDGLWTDASVWSQGRVPTSADQVLVQHSVRLPTGTTAMAKKLWYNVNGHLISDSSQAQLKLGF